MANVSAEIKGTAKQAATAIKGLTGIYATLAKEHGEVSSLLKQALKASSPEERETLLDKIRVELLSHAKAEEQTLYSALAKTNLKPTVDHSKSEHEEIEQLIAQVKGASPGSQQETSALEKLQQCVEHHASEEEQKVFPKAKDVLDRDEEKALDAQFQSKKQIEKDRFSALG